MNNMNFSKNPFNGLNNNTKIAGNHVFKKSDGGRMSLEEVKSNMNEVKNSNVNKKQEDNIIPDKQFDIMRNSLQSLKNIGRNNGN